MKINQTFHYYSLGEYDDMKVMISQRNCYLYFHLRYVDKIFFHFNNCLSHITNEITKNKNTSYIFR